jgi:hypothetical protein
MHVASYAVEVSGWDHCENLFVENTSLEWNEPERKSLRMTHHVRPGTIVFLRVKESELLGITHPVAYRVLAVQAESRGFAVRLEPMHR